MKFPRTVLLTLLAWLMMGPAGASALTLDEILARPAPPAGVVFEIADRDPQVLDLALPWVRQAAEKLKQRFPGLPMALVSHGREMFALQSAHRESNAAVHEQALGMKRELDLPVHVCETHAGWRGIGAEAFPSYIDVAPSGPAQINGYLALDYLRLVVPKAAVLRTLSNKN